MAESLRHGAGEMSEEAVIEAYAKEFGVCSQTKTRARNVAEGLGGKYENKFILSNSKRCD